MGVLLLLPVAEPVREMLREPVAVLEAVAVALLVPELLLLAVRELEAVPEAELLLEPEGVPVTAPVPEMEPVPEAELLLEPVAEGVGLLLLLGEPRPALPEAVLLPVGEPDWLLEPLRVLLRVALPEGVGEPVAVGESTLFLLPLAETVPDLLPLLLGVGEREAVEERVLLGVALTEGPARENTEPEASEKSTCPEGESAGEQWMGAGTSAAAAAG